MKTQSLFFILITLFLCAGCQTASDVTVESYAYTLPVLKGKAHNPVLELRIIQATSPNTGQAPTAIDLDWQGVEQIREVQLFLGTAPGTFSDAHPLGPEMVPQKHMRYTLTAPLQEALTDTLYLWVSATVQPEADLLSRVGVSCPSVRMPQGKVVCSPKKEVEGGLRLGIALRQHNQDGVHTSRIPGLTTTERGSLIAIFDARRDYSRDLQGDIDIALHRSTDGGRTWSPMAVAMDQGTWGDLPQQYNGVSDACVLSDTVTGTVFIAGTWMYGLLDEAGRFIEGLTEESDVWGHQWQKRGSQPGLGVKQTAQFLITRSTDDGLTWSAPVNITETCKKEEWWLFCPAPGKGITLRDGTLVFPAQGRDRQGVPFSCLVYSTDRGDSWHVSNPAYATSTNECAVVQLEDGGLMLNMRCHDNRGKLEGAGNGRAIAVTYDMGQTWTEHPASRNALIESICMASLHKHGKLLLFSNPSSVSTRDKMTLKISTDDGLTWPKDQWILLDEWYGRGYSCLTTVDANTVGILYEGSQADMTFQLINLPQ